MPPSSFSLSLFLSLSISVHVYVCARVCVCGCMYTCMCVYACVCVRARVSVCLRICMFLVVLCQSLEGSRRHVRNDNHLHFFVHFLHTHCLALWRGCVWRVCRFVGYVLASSVFFITGLTVHCTTHRTIMQLHTLNGCTNVLSSTTENINEPMHAHSCALLHGKRAVCATALFTANYRATPRPQWGRSIHVSPQ